MTGIAQAGDAGIHVSRPLPVEREQGEHPDFGGYAAHLAEGGQMKHLVQMLGVQKKQVRTDARSND